MAISLELIWYHCQLGLDGGCFLATAEIQSMKKGLKILQEMDGQELIPVVIRTPRIYSVKKDYFQVDYTKTF